MKRKKIIWILLYPILFLWFSRVDVLWCEVIDKIAAVVGNDIILLSEVVEIANIIKKRAISTMGQDVPDKEAMQMALMELIDNKLIESEAAKLRITIEKEEIDTVFSNQLIEQGISKEEFIKFLQSQGMTEQIYRKFVIRNQLLRHKVLGLKTGGVKVTVEDAKKYYQQQTMSILRKATFKLACIFIAVPENADAVDIANLKEKATEISKMARNPQANFAALAQQYSDDEETAESGGVIGKFKRNELPSEIEKVVINLEEGEVSDPVRTEKGFYIIKVLQKKAPSVKPFEEVKDDIMNDLINNEIQRQIEILLKELRRNTYIDIK